MVRRIACGLTALAALGSLVQAAGAAENKDIATLIDAAPAGAFVTGWLVVILVALLLAVSFLKRSNR